MAQFEIISDKKVRCSHCNNGFLNIFGNLKCYLGSKHKMTSAGVITYGASYFTNIGYKIAARIILDEINADSKNISNFFENSLRLTELDKI
uniref:Transposase n=1 Tax=Strongyloides venezuelensis TaxID=75913 RepID=A0A0K0G5L7_STRVS